MSGPHTDGAPLACGLALLTLAAATGDQMGIAWFCEPTVQACNLDDTTYCRLSLRQDAAGLHARAVNR